MGETPVETALGMAASALAVVSHVPQIWRLATGADDVGALSPGMFVLQLVSGLLWFGYGLAGAHASILVFSTASTLLRAVILAYLARWWWRPVRVAEDEG